MADIGHGAVGDSAKGSPTRKPKRDFVRSAAIAAAVGAPVAATVATAAIVRARSSGDPRIVADLEKYRTIGGWLEPPVDMQPSLDSDVAADVVIVGGGFAGLSTALELTRAGARVAVIEREFCGFGASGRNAGYLAGAGGLEYDLFLKRVGDETGANIVRYYDEAVTYVEGKLEEYEIDCDYVQSGLIRAAVHPSQEDKIRRDMAVGARLGFKSQFLDEAEMRARGIPPAFLFGEYCPGGGTLDPGKYVLGLRQAALRAGVSIYENTPMLSYAGGRTIKLRTPRGSVSAGAVVFATNGYSPEIGILQDKVMPIRVSALETEPLSAAQLASLGWPKREGIVTVHHTMESHRLTARNSVLVTTTRIRYPYGSRTPNVPDYDGYRAIRAALHTRFPSLRDVSVKACWSGYISLATDALPVIGATGADENIYYTAGCSGHGVASQSFVGRLLARRISGVEDPILGGIKHDTPTLLPEPLRWCAVNGALKAADLMDSRVNAKVAGLNG